MASQEGTIANELPATSTQPAPSTFPSTAASEEVDRLLKRQREPESTSPRSTSSTQPYTTAGSAAKSARLALEAQASSSPPLPLLTGAAALDDERRRRDDEQARAPPSASDNPSHTALAALMSGGDQAMSRPSDAPEAPAPPAAMDVSPSKPIESLPDATRADEPAPRESSSLAGAPVMASPAPMDVDRKGDQLVMQEHVAGQEERSQPTSLSYPGSLQTSAPIDTPQRGMSFPSPPQGHAESPMGFGQKKHKCPYCNTEFTRHHNLKSHLLTHSQEKPFLCTDCNMRFRRLHDLKRHGKLHTGEKPHVCPKCDRKFARGDALARHSKGAGGCAGRRSSMGSFADGDDMDASGMGEGNDTTMTGISYEGPEEEELRRQSLPSIQTQQASGSQGESYSAHARTYPPAAGRQGNSTLYPPNVAGSQTSNSTSPSGQGSMTSNHTAHTNASSAPVSAGSTGMYSQSGMTESPKPLSPGAPGSSEARHRSPSLSQQLQQQQAAGRKASDLQTRPGAKLSTVDQPVTTANSHTRSASGNQTMSDSGNMFAQSDPSVWAYIQTLEEKVKHLSEQVVSLDHEVATMKSKMKAQENDVTAGAAIPAPTAPTTG